MITDLSLSLNPCWFDRGFYSLTIKWCSSPCTYASLYFLWSCPLGGKNTATNSTRQILHFMPSTECSLKWNHISDHGYTVIHKEIRKVTVALHQRCYYINCNLIFRFASDCLVLPSPIVVPIPIKYELFLYAGHWSFVGYQFLKYLLRRLSNLWTLEKLWVCY